MVGRAASELYARPTDRHVAGEVRLSVRGLRTVRDPEAPHAIVLDTIKGSGVKEVEDTFSNHSMTVGPEVFDRWINVLKEKLRALEGEVVHA